MGPEERASRNEGYRQGVVLGLTIAEIILLILFALLLAMSGVLMKRQAVIKAQAEEQATAKAMNQKLPPELVAKLEEININLSSPDGVKRMVGILNATQLVGNLKKDKKQTRLELACQAGIELQNALGQNLDAAELIKSSQKLNKDLQALKKEAREYSSSKILPSCYVAKGAAPIFIYDITVRREGLELVDTVPESLRTRFNSDFKLLPSQKPLSDAEFSRIGKAFASYGKGKECKFYVKVYDETGLNKELLKSKLQLIEKSFVWTFMMNSKEDEIDSSDLIFLPAGRGSRK